MYERNITRKQMMEPVMWHQYDKPQVHFTDAGTEAENTHKKYDYAGTTPYPHGAVKRRLSGLSLKH